MPLILFFRPSFDRSLKRLGSDQIKIVALILKTLEYYYASDCDLESARNIAPHFFYKQLRKPYFEAGVESRIRVVIARDGSKCMAVLAGNHNQIRSFLKQV